MNIILIRHGDAENSSQDIKDSERKLTMSGEKKTRKNAQYLRNFVSSFDYIVASPLVRAQQTAVIVAEVFKYKGEIITDKKIASGSTDDIIDIANYLGAKNIAFIGHQPGFSNAVSDLISASGANVEFKKSAAAKISFPRKAYAGKGVLEFLLPPVPEK